MGTDCKIIRNYLKNNDEVVLPGAIQEATTAKEVVEAIIEAFPKFTYGGFSLSKDTSSDPEGLNESIKDFLNTVSEKLTENSNKNLDLSKDGAALTHIIDSLELYYLAESQSDQEEEDLGVMANMEKNEEQRVREKLNSALDRFFKNNVAAREFFKKLVKAEIAVNAIIDFNSDDGIVEDEERLNSNLEKLLNLKYTKVVEYLKSVGTKDTFNLKVFPTLLVKDDHSINPDALKVLYAFYDLLNLKNNLDILLAEVELGWRTASNGGQSIFLDALHSYLVVTYLDDLSADSIGRYIGKNKLEYPIEVDEKGAIKYKYHFGVDRSNRVNSWGVDARDVLKEMGNFTKFLIEMIPLVNIETGEETGDYVTPVQFMNAFTLIFANVQNIKVPSVRNAIIHFSDNPVELLRVILEKVHESVLLHYKSVKDPDKLKSNLYSELVGGITSKGVINAFDLKVLDSAYRKLFLGRRSIYSIEQRYNESHGLSSRYPLVETLASEIQASTAMYYLITRWDREAGTYVTEIKERFAEGNKLHNTRISINRNNLNNSYDENLYKIISKEVTEDSEVLEIKAKDSRIRISIKTDSDSALYGVFTKKKQYNTPESEIITIQVRNEDGDWIDFKELDKSIDLTNYTTRNEVLKNRTGLNKAFLNTLDFIQLFTLLKFGVDNDSLLTYDIYRNQQYGITHDLIFAAVRGLVIANINEKFRNFRLDNPGVYTASQLYKFIEDKKLVSYPITKFKEGGKDWKLMWELTSKGGNLISVYSQEKWLKYYIVAEEIMSGEVSKANIKNGAGDSQPNYGLTFEGANPLKVLNDSLHRTLLKDENGEYILDGDGKPMETYRALDGNIFVLNQNIIVGTSTDMEVTLMDGTNKPVKLMTDSELYYHAIYDKFIISMARNRTMWIQPTTYSDKVKYVLHQVKTNFKDVDLLLAPLSVIEKLYINSIGQQYRYQLKDILNDYAKIYGTPVIEYSSDWEWSADEATLARKVVQTIEAKLRNETEKSLNAKVSAYNKAHPNDRLEFMLDSHFRIIKGTLMFNESLIHLALDVYTTNGIKSRLKKDKFYFMLDLMKGRFGIHYLPTKEVELSDGTKVTQVLTSHPVGKLLSILNANNNLWFNSKNSLVLARTPGIPGPEGEITSINDLKEDSIINPILERFFLIHSLLGNNLRMIHTGSEMNHRNKELEKYNWNKKIGELKNIENANKLSVILKLNPILYNAIVQAASVYGIKNKTMIEKFWNTLSAENVRTIISFMPPEEAKEYNELLEEMLYETEATSLGAQLKRNVSIPATMRPYTPSMKGIGKNMNLAIMKDIRAQIFNIAGDLDGEDAHDGGALINGVTSIHENWSLSENEVGTIKKPIWHSFNGKHGTAGLVKFAAHTMTNNLIRNSLSAVDLLRLSKKMNGTNWEEIPELVQFLTSLGEYDPRALNLLQVAYHSSSGETTFSQLVNGNTEVYYEGVKGEYWAITDLGYELAEDGYGTYTTTEHLAQNTGAYDAGVTVYHYFDENSEHVKSDRALTEAELLERGLHRTRSIYELQQMFGGIYSMEKVNGKLEYSETSNYVAANFINNVTIPTKLRLAEQQEYITALERYNKKYLEYLAKKLAGNTTITPPQKPKLVDKLDLDHYILPLKDNKIDYICNNSAIKNGAGNRNESERFYNDEALDYITMSTEYYGIQMDADHDADEAELTEFSQVISALDAGGRLHPYVTSIYKALGMIALLESKTEYNAISYYLKIANISDDDPDKEEKLKIARDKLYTVIGNTILANLSLGSSRSGLTDSIVKNIKKTFNLNGSHLSDEELKLPFSDSNLYSLVLSTFASLITKKSIRKQYPGIGAVISPAYDMLMVYDIDGEVYKFDDVAKLAMLQYKKWQISDKKEDNPYNKYFVDIKDTDDVSKWKKDLVNAYLTKKEDDLNSNAEYSKALLQEPEDWSDLLQYFDPLNKVKIYYAGDNGLVGEEIVDLSDIRVYYEFMANPANYLRRKLGNKTIKVSSFRKIISKGRNLAPSMAVWTYKDGETFKRKNIYSSAILINLFLKHADKTVKVKGVNSAYLDCLAFYEREKAKDGSYEDVQSLLDDLSKGMWNGILVELKTSEAELIMSNIYLTKFGIDHHVSLADVLKNPKDYFKEKPKPLIYGDADSSFYDLVMLKGNGKHLYISIDSAFSTDEDKYYTTYWKERNLYREVFVDKRSKEEIKANPNKVVNEVYVMDEDNRPAFKVGRDILRTDLSYNSDGNYFYDTKTQEKVSSKNLTYVNGRVIEYVEFVSLHVYRKNGNKFKVFNINTENLRRTNNVSKDDTSYSLILSIIRSLYQADSYELLTINENRIKVNNAFTLKRILPGLAKDFEYDSKLSDYIYNLSNFMSTSLPYIKLENGNYSFVIKDAKSNKLGYTLDKTTGDLIIANKTGARTILRSQINNYYKDLSRKKLASFELARYFTASRIPAQTLQSFMAMKLVAFTGEPGALAYVSHWQTWLQGSDYDIDKAYIMGLAFDDNSSYIGWSTLFDYFDSYTLKASQDLSMRDPNMVFSFSNDDDAIDVTLEVEDISRVDARTKVHRDDTKAKEVLPYKSDFEESRDRVKRVKAYVKILQLLEQGKKIKSTSGYNNLVIKALEKHRDTILPNNSYSQALRNFISSHILGTVQNIRNFKDSYIPVSMDDLRDAAEDSAKGLEAKRITLVNPLSVYKMQRQNMIGKNVIAIAATGQKAAFMWNYYLNDVYSNAKEGVDYVFLTNPETGELLLSEDNEPIIQITENSELQFAQFSFISRILGPLNKKGVDENGDEYSYTEIRTLPDINFERAMDSLRDYAKRHKLNPKKPVDIMISEMISAATDNAKELILAKINAGDTLAKCHLFLITLGFDIDLIVQFMTSDVVDWIDRISGQNIFLGQYKTVNSASTLIKDYLEYQLAILNNETPSKQIRKGDLNLVQQIVPNNLTKELINKYLLYVREFKNILAGANEFSDLGNLLSVNQGIPGKAEDLQARIDKIRDILVNREHKIDLTEYEKFKYKDIANGNFDSVKWLQDQTITVTVPKLDAEGNILTDLNGAQILEDQVFSYRQLTSEYYDKLKTAINIFAVANHLPHFRNMFALMGSEYTVYNFAVKSKLLQKIVKDTKALIPDLYIDSKFYSKALLGANDQLIIKYFKEKDFKFPVKAKTEIIKDANGTTGRVGNGRMLDLSTNVGRANFKYYFETYVIPRLLSGTFEELTDELNLEVAKNEFIRSLVPSIDDSRDIWKLNINMSSESTYTTTQLTIYGKALMQLSYIKINGYSLADWFAIYNLIINKNRYGSDRLTKAFDRFINNYDTRFSSVINDYLRFVGDLDKKDTDVDEEFLFDIIDTFMLQAKIVSDTGGQTDPIVIKLDDDNNFTYYIKVSKDRYVPFKKLVIKNIVGESPDDRLERFSRIRNYFILNNTHTDYIEATLKDLKSTPADALRKLMQDGTLKILIHCE